MKTAVLTIIAVLALACAANAQNNEFGLGAGNGTVPPGYNTGVGFQALLSLTTGTANTANGYQALYSDTTGVDNTANGDSALYSNTTGSDNTAYGINALYSNTTGIGNTAIGLDALYYSSGSANTAIGLSALSANTIGNANMANGFQALYHNTTGSDNTAIGFAALYTNTTGSFNIGLGYSAGQNLTTGDHNIDIGNDGVAGEANTIRIGAQGTNTAAFIAGVSGVTVPGGALVVVGSNGQLGTTTGSGVVQGSLLMLPSTSPAPSGYTLLGTTTTKYKTGKKNQTIDVNLYQKD